MPYHNVQMSDKNRFDTFMRTVAPLEKVGETIIDVIKYYNWTHIAVMKPFNPLGTGDGFPSFIYDGLMEHSMAQKVSVSGPWTLPNPSTSNYCPEGMRQAVKEAAVNSRGELTQ